MMKKFLYITLCSLGSMTAVLGMGGPGGGTGGGGDCFQENTLGTITSCTNCTVVDGSASGDIGGDPSLTVVADGCGPVVLNVQYSFEWNQGANANWIHGISFTAGGNWTDESPSVPTDWLYMPNGVTGCCSNSNYGSGYYFDGVTPGSTVSLTSAPDQITIEFIGPGMCTSTYQNNANPPCSGICNGDECQFTQISGDCQNNGDQLCDIYTGLNPAGGWPSGNGIPDGDPSNNWGVNCTNDCPTFDFELTYCPTNTTPADFLESISFTTSADGESGCWCIDADCDYANSFNVTIQNACGPDAIFNDPPDNYCNAADFDLGNVSANYDGGLPGVSDEWEDATVNSPGDIPALFSYCDNIGNTSIQHTVGENGCYDGPLSETFAVWTPEIKNETADITDGCGTVSPTLSADVDIAGTNTPWGGSGTLEWLEGGSPVTDFSVTADVCAPVSRTFTPRFNTGCAACDVTGSPITVTAHPNYTENIVLNPANCGTAEVQILGNDGSTVCQSYTASCPNPGDIQSTPYSFSTTGTDCDVAFSGTVECACAGCDAEAGSITIPK